MSKPDRYVTDDRDQSRVFMGLVYSRIGRSFEYLQGRDRDTVEYCVRVCKGSQYRLIKYMMENYCV